MRSKPTPSSIKPINMNVASILSNISCDNPSGAIVSSPSKKPLRAIHGAQLPIQSNHFL
ncbi:MAG: hypothetical protein HZR80_14235 [Candidatus Heimdallarchaeota archaeon]